MRSIALGLGLAETYFDDKINAEDHNLRLLSYPPINAETLNKEGQARAGAHTGSFLFGLLLFYVIDAFFLPDYGTLTLLFQDSVSPSSDCDKDKHL
jgi:isopenicillin N synthase-like dioxygenase